MTPQMLASATGAKLARAVDFLPYIEAAMAEFGIDTPERQAAFLAQVGHESGGLHWLVELWGPTPAQERYEGRADLGNIMPGDGFRYRGRGLIQITGCANYQHAGAALGVELEDDPDALAELPLACRSAAWFWKSHGLNALADAGQFEAITRKINGGLNGQADRLARWDDAKEALGVA